MESIVSFPSIRLTILPTQRNPKDWAEGSISGEKDPTHLVQRPAWVARDGKLQVQGQVHDILGCGPDVGIGLDLGQAVADEPDAVDEQAVGIALQLKVAEEGVCAEEGEHLVEDVVALGLGVGRLVGGQGRVGEGQRVCGPTGLCA